MDRKKVLISHELFGINEDFNNPADFVEHVNSVWEKIPEEFKKSAHINFEAYQEYDSYYPTGEIYYYREETDKEVANREYVLKVEQERKEAKELHTYLELKKKYGEKM
jgi:hypothetical protein